MRVFRGLYRMFVFVMVSLAYLFSYLIPSIFGGPSLPRSMDVRNRWAVKAIDLLGMRVKAINQPPGAGYMFLANHRSYMDIAVVLKYISGAVVAKAEIAKWPLIGWGAKASYTIFVKRSDKGSRKKTRKQVKAMLEAGYDAIIFPEGTTFEGPGILDFRPGLFQVAEQGKFPIVPVALEFKVKEDAWTGNDTFVPHFIRAFSKKYTDVLVSFGPVIEPTDWETMHHQAESWVREEVVRLKEMLVQQDFTTIKEFQPA